MSIKYEIIPKTDFHPGGGLAEGMIDQDVVLDREGYPIVRSSHIKGLLRESALEVILLTNKDLACADGVGCKNQGCLLCSLFGWEDTRESLLTINSGRPMEKNKEKIKLLQVSHVHINSGTGTAEKGGLFTERHVSGETVFTGEIGVERVTGKIKEAAEALIRLALTNIKRIGGLRRRGKGRVEFKIASYGQDKIKQDIEIIKSLKREEVISSVKDTRLSPSIPAFKPSKDNLPLYRVHITFTLEEPGLFSEGAIAGNRYKSLPFIPGSTIRGLWAGKFFQGKDPAKDALFRSLCFEGGIRYSHLFPEYEGKPSIPWPLAFQMCKKARGEQDHRKENMLGHTPDVCKCNGSLGPQFKWAFLDEKENEITFSPAPEPLYESYIQNKITRETQCCEEEALYASDVLTKGTTFSGTVDFANKEMFEAWKDLLFGKGEEIKVSLGKGRGRGFGLGKLKIESHAPISSSQCRSITLDGIQAKDAMIFVLIESDTIINSAPYKQPIEKIADALTTHQQNHGFTFKPAESEGSGFNRVREIHGYASHINQPLFTDIAVTGGSCFLIKVEKNDVDDTKLTETLEKICLTGIGSRRDEGYGTLRIYIIKSKDALPLSIKWDDLEIKTPSRPGARSFFKTQEEIKLFQEIKKFCYENRFHIRNFPSSHLLSSLSMISTAESLDNELRHQYDRSTAKKAWEEPVKHAKYKTFQEYLKGMLGGREIKESQFILKYLSRCFQKEIKKGER